MGVNMMLTQYDRSLGIDNYSLCSPQKCGAAMPRHLRKKKRISIPSVFMVLFRYLVPCVEANLFVSNRAGSRMKLCGSDSALLGRRCSTSPPMGSTSEMHDIITGLIGATTYWSNK